MLASVQHNRNSGWLSATVQNSSSGRLVLSLEVDAQKIKPVPVTILSSR
jgi:hypothetical protein